MTTTISPSIGHAPLMTQAGTGASPGYDAVDVRRMTANFDLGEGVETYDSYRVSQRGAGANMSVDCNMDQHAYIRGDAVALQGIYKIAPHSATINESVTAADGTNPRVDRVILELKDNTHDASGSNLVQTRVVAGTPTGGATLDNLTGAASVPNSAMLLADVLVPALSTSVTNANIRDRRPFLAGVPPLLTDVDMVALTPFPSMVSSGSVGNPSDLAQSAALMYLSRRIASATRIRWRYTQGGTAATGNYVLSIFDASGRKIIDTGSVALTGATGTIQQRSETITATTFEPGAYYAFFGLDLTNAGTFTYQGVQPGSAFVQNVLLYSTTGGVTVPTTILGLTDFNTTISNNVSGVPFMALSVG